jgi:N-methylhydantoinase A
MRIGIDTGGTFTDFVVLRDDGHMESFKLRSDPHHPARVILEGLRRAGGLDARIIHGSTVATNALLERKGARTAFVTTAGFEDIVLIGRQNRAELYNLTPAPRRPLVPSELCFGVDERAYYDGTIARRPARAGLERLRKRLARARVRSVAVCLLHSYQNPENERAVASALASGIYLCCSDEVCPEFREYERASTTVLNAYVGPLMDAYLGELDRAGLRGISILQSNGGFMTAAEARRQAVRTILSGPAGGAIGAVRAARLAGFQRAIGFDMGGTSTDVSICDRRPRETTEGSVDGFPVRVPMLDIHTVGAGGGSIARVDEGGLLRVGPESAGADPGPACYGKGDRATVTDAHVVLGRIAARQFLGGEMAIDVGRSAAAVDRIARALAVSRTAAAEGILRVADANMDRAIRVVTVERGHDPRDFALVAFGGCGGLHACGISAELGIRTVIVPRLAGALSALGMVSADRIRDFTASVLNRRDLAERLAELEKAASREMPGARLERLADIRYAGQSYELTVKWNPRDPAAPFHREHRRQYGYASPERATEIVNLRVRGREVVAKPRLRRPAPQPPRPEKRRVRIEGRWRRVPVWTRERLPSGAQRGPALVVDYGSTTLVPPGWKYFLDDAGNLVVKK